MQGMGGAPWILKVSRGLQGFGCLGASGGLGCEAWGSLGLRSS